jgi:hypothetical protein
MNLTSKQKTIRELHSPAMIFMDYCCDVTVVEELLAAVGFAARQKQGLLPDVNEAHRAHGPTCRCSLQ